MRYSLRLMSLHKNKQTSASDNQTARHNVPIVCTTNDDQPGEMLISQLLAKLRAQDRPFGPMHVLIKHADDAQWTVLSHSLVHDLWHLQYFSKILAKNQTLFVRFQLL